MTFGRHSDDRPKTCWRRAAAEKGPGWGDTQEHATLSQHMRFGIPTQPVGMDARQVHRHANLANHHPCNTRVILFSPHPPGRVEAITPAPGADTSSHVRAARHISATSGQG